MLSYEWNISNMRFYCRDLYAWEEKRNVAIDTFLKNKPYMMHVAIHGLENDLKLKATP